MKQNKSDHGAIIKIVEAMAAAQTADELTAHWTQDIVWFDTGNLFIEGDRARAEYRTQFEAITNLRTEILTIDANSDGDIGFAHSVQHFMADSPIGGPGIDMVFRQTDCLVRTEGIWSIAHQHVSLPIDFRTGSAILNSAPPTNASHDLS